MAFQWQRTSDPTVSCQIAFYVFVQVAAEKKLLVISITNETQRVRRFLASSPPSLQNDSTSCTVTINYKYEIVCEFSLGINIDLDFVLPSLQLDRRGALSALQLLPT